MEEIFQQIKELNQDKEYYKNNLNDLNEKLENLKELIEGEIK